MLVLRNTKRAYNLPSRVRAYARMDKSYMFFTVTSVTEFLYFSGFQQTAPNQRDTLTIK